MNARVLIVVCLALLSFKGMAEPDDSPQYKGYHKDGVKALSEKEIHQLLQGKGMGMAKVAELNGYPGPKHVLELKQELNLTPEQEEQTQLLFAAMHAKAAELGQELVAIEQEMEAKFAAGVDKPQQFRKWVMKSAKLRGQIRQAHIQAHVNQKKVLTADQITAYTELRKQGKGGHHGKASGGCGKCKKMKQCSGKRGGEGKMKYRSEH